MDVSGVAQVCELFRDGEEAIGKRVRDGGNGSFKYISSGRRRFRDNAGTVCSFHHVLKCHTRVLQ